MWTYRNGGYRSIFVGRSWKLCIRCRFISRLVPYLLMLLCLLQKLVEYWYVFKCFEVMFRLQIKLANERWLWWVRSMSFTRYRVLVHNLLKLWSRLL